MEHNANDNMPSQALCRMGCGFYGNQTFDGLCSKCYKDALKRKQNSSPVNGRSSPSVTSTASSVSCLGQGEKDSVAMTSVASALAQASLGQDNSDNTSSTSLNSLVAAAMQQSVSTASPTVMVPGCDRTLPGEATTGDGAAGSESSSASSVVENADEQQLDRRPKKNRCHTCKKKVGLTGFQCRCSGLFCALHRYSDKHECPFDYREFGQEQIRRNNPVIKGDKLQKI